MPRRPRKRTYRTGGIARQGRRWRIRWRVGTRRMSATFASRELAEQALAGKVGAVALGEAGIRPDPRKVPTLQKLFKPWLERRQVTHRDWRNDQKRWTLHLKTTVGHLRPSEVDQGTLRSLIDSRLRAGLATTTTRLVLRLLSTFFSDLVDDGHAQLNPVKALPKRVRRRLRPTHDPKTTPFLERLEDVRRLFQALPEPVNIAFAIGALAGLRTGEVIGLAWDHIDLEAGRIHVQVAAKEGQPARLKDEDSRIVPIQASLLPQLKAWRLRNKGALVIPPLRKRRTYLHPSTLWKALVEALETLGKEDGARPLPALSWYQATRHTFASQWVIGGGTLERLKEIMGHSTVLVTERYAHLRPREDDRDRVLVDLTAPKAAPVVHLGPTLGPSAPAGGDRLKASKRRQPIKITAS